MIWDTLVDDLTRAMDRDSVSLMLLLNLSAAFHTIDHGGILLACLSWGWAEQCFVGSPPSSRMDSRRRHWELLFHPMATEI